MSGRGFHVVFEAVEMRPSKKREKERERVNWRRIKSTVRVRITINYVS